MEADAYMSSSFLTHLRGAKSLGPRAIHANNFPSHPSLPPDRDRCRCYHLAASDFCAFAVLLLPLAPHCVCYRAPTYGPMLVGQNRLDAGAANAGGASLSFCMYTSKQTKHASAGNRTRVTSMATMYSATRPLMQCSQPAVPRSPKPNELNCIRRVILLYQACGHVDALHCHHDGRLSHGTDCQVATT